MHPQTQAIWGNIWKSTVEKRQTNAINANMHLLMQAIWGRIWKYTVEKSETNATSVIIHLVMLKPWGDIWKLTVEKNQTNETSTTLHPPREKCLEDAIKNKNKQNFFLFPLTVQLTQKYDEQITRNLLFTSLYFFWGLPGTSVVLYSYTHSQLLNFLIIQTNQGCLYLT